MSQIAPIVSPSSQATSLNDERILTEVQRITREASIYPAARDQPTKRIDIGGVSYCIRVALTGLSAAVPVTVVFIERCTDHPLPSEETLRRTFRLSRTEVRVALMLAKRRSNREITAELAVSSHTARRHTENVLAKLGVHHRTDVRNALLSEHSVS